MREEESVIAVESRRKTELLSDGGLLIEDVLEVQGSGEMTFVVGSAWLLELHELEAGEYSYICGDRRIRPGTRRFGALYTPFSIIRLCFDNPKGRWSGMTSTARLPAGFDVPMIFETDFRDTLVGYAQLDDILRRSRNRQSIEINPQPLPVSLKAKKLIDETYSIQPVMARIAARLGVTHEHLSRQFKRDFGLSPGSYCHQLRIADATARLARGEEIIDVSLDVGYNDLSRFYKQFRKSTAATPGYCRTPKKGERTRKTRK